MDQMPIILRAGRVESVNTDNMHHTLALCRVATLK
uniref:Uncharacterized protein n=1 Tax=Arundo donax TaxID=35708 RepID=A0A0A9C6J8_ARUDO